VYEQADTEPDYASGDHVCLSILCCPSNHGGCRSRLQFAMQDVAAKFQKQPGKEVKLIYGSSGNFFEQL
jgi:molybdate transport system substrate-binding protein